MLEAFMIDCFFSLQCILPIAFLFRQEYVIKKYTEKIKRMGHNGKPYFQYKIHKTN